MANNQRCICRSHEPVDQARVNFLVFRFRDLLPLTALHHCIDNRKVKQPYHNLSENIYIRITNDHFLWFQGTRRWRDIFIDSKVKARGPWATAREWNERCREIPERADPKMSAYQNFFSREFHETSPRWTRFHIPPSTSHSGLNDHEIDA